MLRLVIFDFDGVIADSEPVHFEMLRQTLATQGVTLNWNDYKARYLGYEDFECIARILKDRQEPASDVRVTELARQKTRRFAQHLADQCVIMPGVRPLLERLRQERIGRAICSGALRREIEAILEHNRLREFFDEIVAADDVAAGKPDPQGYRLSLERVNQRQLYPPAIQPGECLVIEDSMWGIQAARGAGMPCLAVTSSYPAAELRQADAVTASLEGLSADYLRTILNGKPDNR